MSSVLTVIVFALLAVVFVLAMLSLIIVVAGGGHRVFDGVRRRFNGADAGVSVPDNGRPDSQK